MKAARKSSSTRRAAAFAFLSGISLDGKPETSNSQTRPSPTAPERVSFGSSERQQPAWPISGKAQGLSRKFRREQRSFVVEERGRVTQQQVSRNGNDATPEQRPVTGKRSMSVDVSVHGVTPVKSLTFDRRPKRADWKVGNVDSRLVITYGSGLPVAVFSTLSYRKSDGKEGGVEKHKPRLLHSESGVSLIEGVQMGKSKSAVSYYRMLESTYAVQDNELLNMEKQEVFPVPMSPVAECSLAPVTATSLHLLGVYNPNIFDDPELQSGKYRKVMTMRSYRLSVLEYARPLHIKRDLNDQFRERFPHVQLTLSKLRSIKKCLLKVALRSSLDLVVVALTYVYFEKFVWKSKVNKSNRNIAAGCCLLLAAKMSDVKHVDIRPLMDNITDGLHISHRDLLHYEFPVLVALEFSLHVPHIEVQPHLNRLESSV